MSIGPNAEPVDVYLDAQDLAVQHDKERGPSYGGKCGLCGHVVRQTIRGLCDDCRALEGSVWQYGWGG